MSLKRRQMDEQKEMLHFSTTPRAEVTAMLKLLRYQPIDRGEDDEHSVIVLNFDAILRNKYQDVCMGAFTVRILTPLLRVYQFFRMRHLNAFHPEAVKEIATADDSFDDLWQRTKKKYSNTNVRTADTVNWYCFSNKQAVKKLLGYYEGGKLIGYMAFMANENPEVRILECVDLWIDSDGGEGRILGSLVAKAQDCAKQFSFDQVMLPHFNRETAALYKKLGLLRQRTWKKNEYIKAPQHILEKITAENSYFVSAQGDYGL